LLKKRAFALIGVSIILILNSLSVLAEGVRPDTGTFLKDSTRDGLGGLKIINDNPTLDAVAVLTASDKQPLLALYIRSKESFTISNIKDGSYNMFFELGSSWDALSSKFTTDSEFYSLDSPLTFKTSEDSEGTKYHIWTVALERAVPGANAAGQRIPVNEKDFPEISTNQNASEHLPTPTTGGQSFLTPSSKQENTSQYWLGKGKEYYQKGLYEEAINCCDKALEINPQDVDAWGNRGISYAKLYRYNEAIECFAKIIEINPSNSKAWFAKGNALASMGKYEEAIKCFDEAIAIDPSYAEAVIQKGRAQEFLSRNKNTGMTNTDSKVYHDDTEPMPVKAPNSSLSMPSYSQVLKTYPESAKLCCMEANVTNVTEKGWTLSNIKCLPISNNDIQTKCYGAKITLDILATIDNQKFEKGAKLTVDKDLHWVQVSSWD
jgi:tetratricopeptide (TPR) repeat protein